MQLKAHFASRAYAPRARHGFIWNCLYSTNGERGTTFVEIVIAGTILAVGLSGLYALLGATVKEVTTSNTASIAQQNTVARMDQIRSLTWASLTSADYVKSRVLNTATSSANSSTISREVVSISPAAVPQSSPLPSPTPAVTPTPGAGFSVTKIGTATPVISPAASPNLLSEKLLNVTVTTEWDSSGKTHQRQLSALISRAGSAPFNRVTPTPSPTP